MSRKGVPLLKSRTFDYDKAAELYRAGRSLSEVGAQLGVAWRLVQSALKRMGVPMRRRGGGDGDKNHRFKGGTRLNNFGYVLVLGSRNRKLEHRVIAGNAIGRPLKRSEDVHHVYGDRTDNTNLVICTHAYHMALHARMRKHPYWRQFTK